MDGLVVEIDLSHVVHVVMEFGLDEVVGNHGVPHRTSEVDVIVAQHFEVILQILSHFKNFVVLVHLFKDIDNSQRFFTFSRNRHVKCLEFLHGETQTYQFGIDCNLRGGFRV